MRRVSTWLAAAPAVFVLVAVTIPAGAATPRSSVTKQPRPIAAPRAKQPHNAEGVYSGLLDDAQLGGRRGARAALRAFELTVAPVPGVSAPRAPKADGPFSGTEALNAVIAHWDDLTRVQRRAVARALTPGTPSPGGPGRSVRVQRSAPDSSTVQQEVDKWTQVIATRLVPGVPVPPNVNVWVNAKVLVDEGYALALPHSADWTVRDIGVNAYKAKAYGGCEIYVNPRLLQTDWFSVGIAFTVFECFQGAGISQATGSLDGFYTGLRWVIAGQAVYAAADLAPSPPYQVPWQWYLTHPRDPFSGTNANIGFYSHVAESGVDPWTIFAKQWAGPTDAALAFDAAGATSDAFLDTWGSGYVREPRGPQPRAWYTSGPKDPGPKLRGTLEPLAISNGQARLLTAKPRSSRVLDITSYADLVHVIADAHARISDARGVDVLIAADPNEGWLCTDPNRCVCPKGQTYTGPAFTRLGDDPKFALSAGNQVNKAIFSAYPLKRFCQKAKEWVLIVHPGSYAGAPPSLVASTCDGAHGHWTGTVQPTQIGGGAKISFDFTKSDVAHVRAHLGPIPYNFSGKPSSIEYSYDLTIELRIADDGTPAMVIGGSEIQKVVSEGTPIPPGDPVPPSDVGAARRGQPERLLALQPGTLDGITYEPVKSFDKNARAHAPKRPKGSCPRGG